MTRVTSWVGAGLLTAGVSAAVLAGAGTANADEDDGPKQDRASAATKDDSAQRSQHRGSRSAKQQPKSEVAGSATADKVAVTKKRETRAAARTEVADRSSDQLADSARENARAALQDSARDIRDAVTDRRDAIRDVVEEATRGVTGPTWRTADAPIRPQVGIRSALAASSGAVSPSGPPDPAAERHDIQAGKTLRKTLDSTLDQANSAARAENLGSATPAQDPVEAIHDVLRSLGGLVLNPEPQDYPEPLSLIGDVVFDTLATLERVVGGDPVVPPGLRDSVEVSTSTLVISDGHEVESNWYFPTTEDGQPAPTRLIYLQHGFLANGPIYSYTASHLADLTDSIVVTTTFTSNPFEADGMWLGGDNLHEAVAQLFLDPDRAALNASMDAAEQSAGRVDLAVPTAFVLVGHSLGGGFAPGVAGYYAAGLVSRREQGLGAPNQLEGAVIYDAVPMGSIIPDAMESLDALEASDPNDAGEDYIPIYEIGAPLNYLNVFSDVNDQLTEARPGQFTGVVLEGGAHSDPMQGGNPLIQFALYVAAGFPQPQNPLATRELSVGWIDDMFEDRINPETGTCTGVDCAGQYGEEGTYTFDVETDEGNAVAVLIGSQRATDLTSLRAISLTDFVAAIPAGVLNGLQTTCDLVTGGSCPV